MDFIESIKFVDEPMVDEHGHGYLYLCPTPIGNLEDITLRTYKILKEVDYVAAEDTRNTGRLLQCYGLNKSLISYHEHNKEAKGLELIELLKSGKSIAIVSDAGMPAISDPGADIVIKAIANNLSIVPLPGANAALTALMVSGLDTTEFTFVGFLPKRKKHRTETLERIKSYQGTLIFYEAPHRIEEVLNAMYQVLGDRPVVLGREVTKKFETFTRTTLANILAEPNQIIIKGEFVVLVGGVLTVETEMVDEEQMNPVEAVLSLINDGIAKKDAIREIAKERNISRREIYNAVESALNGGQ